jgi:hypothetical protein
MTSVYMLDDRYTRDTTKEEEAVMAGTVKSQRRLTAWFSAHFGLVTILGLLALIVLVAFLGIAFRVPAGA